MVNTNSKKMYLFLLLVIPFFIHAQKFPNPIINQALALKLYDSHVWKNLLHVKSNIPSINDSTFLLSHSNFSLKNELQMTIKSFFNTNIQNNNHGICKYPARFFWLKKKLNLNDDDFPKPKCKLFHQYLKKTGAKNIQLVFVSENTSSPSSMMGHVFFKLTGYDDSHTKLEHAVSFFTVIDTINPLLLMVKSTITGMKGFFILRPYKEQIERYLKEENRNIWEYSLNLSEEEQQLIYYHFWELKDVKIKYLFTGFNCATIVHDMLSMTSAKFSNDDRLWITPKDVIKDAKKSKIIKGVTLRASEKWHIKMLLEKLKESNSSSLVNTITNVHLNSIGNIKFSSDLKTMFLEKELLIAYAQYQYEHDDIRQSTEYEIAKLINLKREIQTEKYSLDLSSYKNPLNTFDDTQIGLSYIRSDSEKSLLFSFLPASNTIYDDNREYFGESDLRIMELNLLINKNRVKIDSFNLYKMKSLLPWDSLTGGISSALSINYEPHYDTKLGKFKAYNISAGIGYTKQYYNDIFVYSLLNGGIAYGESKFYTYLYPEVGLLMYEIFDMKTVLNYKYIYNQHGSDNAYHDLRMEQALFIDKKVRLGFGIDYKSIRKNQKTNYIFSLNYFF